MTRLRYRMRAPGNLTAVFLAVAAVAVSALVWIGAGIVRRDRALEIRRFDERREAAADRLVASLERALASDERLLAGTAKPAGDLLLQNGARPPLHAGPGTLARVTC
jgi:hypothetical protein